MTEQDQHSAKDNADDALDVLKLGLRAQALITDFMARNSTHSSISTFDPLNISSAFIELSNRMLNDPTRVVQAQTELWQDYLKLWQSTSMQMLGQDGENIIDPNKGDKRFKSEEWRDNQIFNFIKQGYLLTAKHIENNVTSVEGLSGQDQAKVEFYTKQFLDALSPSNSF